MVVVVAIRTHIITLLVITYVYKQVCTYKYHVLGLGMCSVCYRTRTRCILFQRFPLQVISVQRTPRFTTLNSKRVYVQVCKRILYKETSRIDYDLIVSTIAHTHTHTQNTHSTQRTPSILLIVLSYYCTNALCICLIVDVTQGVGVQYECNMMYFSASKAQHSTIIPVDTYTLVSMYCQYFSSYTSSSLIHLAFCSILLVLRVGVLVYSCATYLYTGCSALTSISLYQ